MVNLLNDYSLILIHANLAIIDIYILIQIIKSIFKREEKCLE